MPTSSVRFGPFELDLRSAELRKDNLRVHLQERPFQVLVALLEQPGKVVLREEIRRKLWPNDVVVEFDHSINAAVKRLRSALRDSAEKPRYIETLGRRGYRFVGQLETASTEQAKVPIDQPAVRIDIANGAGGPLVHEKISRELFLKGSGRAVIGWLRRIRFLVPLVLAALFLTVLAVGWYFWPVRHSGRENLFAEPVPFYQRCGICGRSGLLAQRESNSV